MRNRNEKVLYSLFLLLIESIVKISCKIRLSEIYIFLLVVFENGENFHSLFHSMREEFEKNEREFELVRIFSKKSSVEEEKIYPSYLQSDLKDHKKNFPFCCSWNVESSCSFFFRIDIDEENSNFIIIFRKTNNDPTFRDLSWKDREREKGTQKTGQPTSIFHLVWKKGLPPFRKPGEFSSTILNFKLLYSP